MKDFHRALSKDSIQTQGHLYFANKPLTFFLMHHFKILPKSSFVRHVFGLFSSRLWRTSKTTSWTAVPIERVNRKAWQVYIIIFWHFLFYMFTFRRSTSSIYIFYSFKLWFLQYLCSAEFIIFFLFFLFDVVLSFILLRKTECAWSVFHLQGHFLSEQMKMSLPLEKPSTHLHNIRHKIGPSWLF